MCWSSKKADVSPFVLNLMYPPCSGVADLSACFCFVFTLYLAVGPTQGLLYWQSLLNSRSSILTGCNNFKMNQTSPTQQICVYWFKACQLEGFDAPWVARSTRFADLRRRYFGALYPGRADMPQFLQAHKCGASSTRSRLSSYPDPP